MSKSFTDGFTFIYPMYDRENKEKREIELHWRDIDDLEDFVDMMFKFKQMMKNRDLLEEKQRRTKH